MHVDTVGTMVQNIIHLMVQMSTLSIQTILVNLTILSLNLMKYTLELPLLMFIILSTM